MSSSLQPFGLQSSRLLCPRDFSGKNIGVGFHFLLQGMFMTQRLNLYLLSLTLQAGPLPAEPIGKTIFTSRSRQIRISLKEKRNLLLHIKHFQLLLCLVFPVLNCYFIPFSYFSFRIFNLQVLSDHKDITVSALGKEKFCFIIFPGHQGDVTGFGMTPNQGGFSSLYCLRVHLGYWIFSPLIFLCAFNFPLYFFSLLSFSYS